MELGQKPARRQRLRLRVNYASQTAVVCRRKHRVHYQRATDHTERIRIDSHAVATGHHARTDCRCIFVTRDANSRW